MTQYGFFFDEGRCDHCSSCTVACKMWNNIPPGPVKWLRHLEWESGSFPNQRLHQVWAACYHCLNPVCVDAANGAMYKEEKYGAVLIDPDKATSMDLRKAQEACPYGAIQFDSDAMNATASKCTMCIDRLEDGKMPICVMTCHMRAFDFGTFEDMKTKHSTLQQLEGMPDPAISQPAIVFGNQRPKRQIVPYDVNRALQLLAKRPYGLPDVYSSPQDATDIPQGLLARDRLNMKPKNWQEILRYATHNDG